MCSFNEVVCTSLPREKKSWKKVLHKYSMQLDLALVVRLQRQYQHPNLVQCLEYWSTGGFCVMPGTGQCGATPGTPLILLLLEEGSVSALEVVLVDDRELPLDAIESPRPGDLLKVGLADK